MSEYKISFGEQEARAQSGAGFIGRLLLSWFMAVVAVAISAVVWGGLAYLTNSIYVALAVFIGFAISFAITFPFSRLSWLTAVPLFLMAAVLTVAAVLLGDYLYYIFLVMAEGSKAAPVHVLATHLVEVTVENSLPSVLFALFGTLIGFINAVRNN